MYKWDNVQTKTEMEFVLSCIKDKINSSKIKRIFDLEGGYGEHIKENCVNVTLDDEVYIEFENNNCLIINLTQESDAYIEYRELTDDEKNRFSLLPDASKDLFNSHHEIHDWDTKADGSREPSKEPYKTTNISLKYDEISSFEVIGFNHSFEKWISKGEGLTEIEIPAGGDYFNQINIVLKNGVTIYLAAEEAIFDGYADIWVDDKSGNLIIDEKIYDK